VKKEVMGCICRHVAKKDPFRGSALLDLLGDMEISFGEDGKSAVVRGYIDGQPCIVAHIEDDPELEAILSGSR